MKNIKIKFDPNCFVDFEGSQEELDQMVNEIKDLILTSACSEEFESFSVEPSEISNQTLH